MTAIDPQVEGMPDAFMGYKLGGNRLIVRVCMRCDGKEAVEAWAHRKGSACSHGLCTRHAQEEMAKLMGDKSNDSHN